MTTTPSAAAAAGPLIRDDIPHSARVWNYWLGGKDYYEIDRIAGDAGIEIYPGIIDVARHSREVLLRVVRFVVRECGIRQILDIGPGLPGMSNTHEVAQGIEPSARVVYVDSDPLVLTHARALLTSTTPEGVVGVVDADLRDSAGLLAAAYATLEPGEPVAILLMGVLGYVSWDEARYAVQALRAAVPDGSYLAIWDGVTTCEAHTRWWDLYPETGATPYRLTSPAGLESLFSGTELVTPGVVPIDRWRPTRTRFTGDRGALPAQGGLGRIHGGRAW